MSPKPILEDLRDRVRCLEETQRQLAPVISISELVDAWLPYGGLPSGCIHEVKSTSLASALAFSSILSARLAGEQGNILYIAPDRSLHPLGLLPFGVKLDKLLHVSVRRAPDLIWAVMEALRCSQVSAVMTLLSGVSLTESRRLQLAAETSGATGFFLGNGSSAPVASPVTRWKVSAMGRVGQRFDQPVWNLDLLYCRGGRPGSWLLEWSNRILHDRIVKPAAASQQTIKALAG